MIATAVNPQTSSSRCRGRWIAGLATLAALTTTGCFGAGGGYNLGILGYPMPVSPYYQHKQEQKFYEHERYDRVPILGLRGPGEGS